MRVCSEGSFNSCCPVGSAVRELGPMVGLVGFIVTVLVLLLDGGLRVGVFILALAFIVVLLDCMPFGCCFGAF